MEGYFSTGQSPQWAVVPIEEEGGGEEEEEEAWLFLSVLLCPTEWNSLSPN